MEQKLGEFRKGKVHPLLYQEVTEVTQDEHSPIMPRAKQPCNVTIINESNLYKKQKKEKEKEMNIDIKQKLLEPERSS